MGASHVLHLRFQLEDRPLSSLLSSKPFLVSSTEAGPHALRKEEAFWLCSVEFHLTLYLKVNMSWSTLSDPWF